MNKMPPFLATGGKAKPLAEQEVSCQCCGMFGMCNEAGLSRDEPLLEQVVSRRTPLERHAALVEAGTPFTQLYAVKSGALAVFDEGEGGARPRGFYLPGDLIGLDAIHSGHYQQTVVALERVSVCRLELERVGLLGERQGAFYQQLIQAMSRRLVFEQWGARLLGAHSTEQRVASFLLYLASHLKGRGLPYREFRLPMSRDEIAGYLGLAMETVSRTFSLLQREGLVALKGRSTRLCDLAALHRVAGLAPHYTGLPAG